MILLLATALSKIGLVQLDGRFALAIATKVVQNTEVVLTLKEAEAVAVQIPVPLLF